MFINSKVPTGLMIGHFQEWNDNHRTLFKKILKKEGHVCIAIRDIQGTDEQYKFDAREVASRINMDLLSEFQGKYAIYVLPNITGVYYDSNVEYKIEQLTSNERE